MNIVVEKLPKCLASLRVEIPADTVAAERKKITQSYVRAARIPGFRPGKAPAAMVTKRYDKEIREELTDNLVNAAFDQALEQENLGVLSFGQLRDARFNDDGTFSFESTLTLAPEIQLPEYKGIPVKTPPQEVPESAVEEQLLTLRRQAATYEDITDRGAELEDLIVFDYTTTVEGQPTAEFVGREVGYLGGRQDYWTRLDAELFLPGFAAQVVGLKPGDAKDITIQLPEDFLVDALATKEMVVSTTIKELKRQILPELDDAFANSLLPGRTLEDIKSLISANLEREHQQKIADSKVSQIIQHLNSQVECELPEELVNSETQKQIDEMVNQGVRNGLQEDDLKAMEASLFEAAGQRATLSIRSNFILQEIAIAEKITVSDQELVTHLSQVSARHNVPLKKLIRDLQRARRIQSVRQSILTGKVIDFLLTQAIVEEDSTFTLND